MFSVHRCFNLIFKAWQKVLFHYVPKGSERRGNHRLESCTAAESSVKLGPLPIARANHNPVFSCAVRNFFAKPSYLFQSY